MPPVTSLTLPALFLGNTPAGRTRRAFVVELLIKFIYWSVLSNDARRNTFEKKTTGFHNQVLVNKRGFTMFCDDFKGLSFKCVFWLKSTGDFLNSTKHDQLKVSNRPLTVNSRNATRACFFV